MSEGFQFLDIIFFAMVAVFLVLRLRNVLGRRTGNEQRRDPFAGRRADETAREKVIPLPDRTRTARAEEPAVDIAGDPLRGEQPASGAAAGTAEPPGIRRIRQADPSFDAERFVAGARAAFEMVVAAFAAGETAALRPLLSDDVFENFNGAIKARARAREKLETTLVGINSADIVEADLQGRNAVVTVKFVSEQINVTRDSAGKVVDGDPGTVTKVTDLWTFSRNVRSRDPNWTLVATGTAN